MATGKKGPKATQAAAELLINQVKVKAAKNPTGRPAFALTITDAHRQQVMTLAEFGIPQEHICQLVWPNKLISSDTLQRHFKTEFEKGRQLAKEGSGVSSVCPLILLNTADEIVCSL
jgi:hypothetical protein